MAKKKRGKKSGISIPSLDGVEGKSVTVPEGQYNVNVVEISQESGKGEFPYLKWVFQVTSGSCISILHFLHSPYGTFEDFLRLLMWRSQKGNSILKLVM